MATHIEVVSAYSSEKITTAESMEGRLKDIDSVKGEVISVLPHPYDTDGLGPKLIIVWRDAP